MLSPSPTQPPPVSPAPEKKKVQSTLARKRMGETPGALFVKGLLRPIFKLLYYSIQGIRRHKLLALGMIVLLLATISATTFFTTGQLPLGIGKDQFNFNVRGNQAGGDQVRNWLYALRDGDTTKLALVQSQMIMSSPPDPNQLIAQYSQTQGHLTWKDINVVAVYTQSDTTVDSFVSVEAVSSGPGGANKIYMLWHFTTLPQSQGRLLSVSLVDARQSLM